MSDILTFRPGQPGELDRLTTRLYLFPRSTEYQRLCFRIAEKSLNLPARHGRGEGKLLRQLDKLDPTTVQRWLLEASRINALAAMVMLDSMDFFCDCLQFLTDEHHGCFDSRFKADFTRSIGGLSFVFRIPAGWELSLFHDRFDEGNYSVGHVVRCHLSQSTTHENWGFGHLLGKEYSEPEYFGVPCEIVPKFKRSPIDVDEECWWMGTVTATIPFQWIIQVRAEDRETGKAKLQSVPSGEEILAVADEAVEVVKTRFEEIERRMREPHDGSSPGST